MRMVLELRRAVRRLPVRRGGQLSLCAIARQGALTWMLFRVAGHDALGEALGQILDREALAKLAESRRLGAWAVTVGADSVADGAIGLGDFLARGDVGRVIGTRCEGDRKPRGKGEGCDR